MKMIDSDYDESDDSNETRNSSQDSYYEDNKRYRYTKIRPRTEYDEERTSGQRSESESRSSSEENCNDERNRCVKRRRPRSSFRTYTVSCSEDSDYVEEKKAQSSLS